MPKNSLAIPSPRSESSSDDTDGLPTLTREGVVRYCADLGLTVTERYVREHSRSGSLPSFVLRNRIMFSRRDVRAWLMSLRRG